MWNQSSKDWTLRDAEAKYTDILVHAQLQAMRQSGLLPQAGSEQEKAMLHHKANDDTVSKAVPVEDVISSKLVSKARFKNAMRAFEKDVPEPGPDPSAKGAPSHQQQQRQSLPGSTATNLRRTTFGYQAETETETDSSQTAARASWKPAVSEPVQRAPMLEPSTTADAMNPSSTASVLGQIGKC